ncbi:Uncharacterised protein [Mycobacterium tuberculosis]|nr:Uncharacterised protein [Mycobacterium tuberculosis]
MAASATSLAVTPNLWHTASTASRGTRMPSASSQSLASRWAADMAPAMQWWIFIKIAQRLPLRPSMIQHSHSGRSGSRGRSSASAMARNSSASSPGRGSATRRTCWVRSNPG